MTKKFKVGERVAIYHSDRRVGVVEELRCSDGYWVRVPGENGLTLWTGLVHERQMRKLTKRPNKPVTIWVEADWALGKEEYSNPAAYKEKTSQSSWIKTSGKRFIEFQEVRKSKN